MGNGLPGNEWNESSFRSEPWIRDPIFDLLELFHAHSEEGWNASKATNENEASIRTSKTRSGFQQRKGRVIEAYFGFY
jgi:hypothetical protein